MSSSQEPLEGLAAADAHLGRPVPLPSAPLPLVRWSEVHAVSPEGIEIALNLDDTRAGSPGRLAFYVGWEPPPARAWPGADPPRTVAVGDAHGSWREAALLEAQPSLRPAIELSWEAHALHLRLTAQGPWEPAHLIAIAASVGDRGIPPAPTG